MADRDLHSGVTVWQLVPASGYNANSVPNIATYTNPNANLQGVEGMVSVVANVGIVTGTNPTLNLDILSASAASGTYTDTGVRFPQITTSGVYEVGLTVNNINQFIGVSGVIGGTASPTFQVGVTAVGRNQTIS